MITKGEEAVKDEALKGNEDNADKEMKEEGEEEAEEEMEEEEIEDDSLIADRINENSYIYLIEQETFAHVKNKVEGD